MKINLVLPLALILLACGTAQAGEPAAADPSAEAAPAPEQGVPCSRASVLPVDRPPRLTGSDCLDPDWARSWHYVDEREILVDAGRKHYRIRFFSNCQELSSQPDLVFRGDRVSGRICGYMSDVALVRGRECSVESIEMISAEEYKEASRRPRGSAEVSASTDGK